MGEGGKEREVRRGREGEGKMGREEKEGMGGSGRERGGKGKRGRGIRDTPTFENRSLPLMNCDRPVTDY